MCFLFFVFLYICLKVGSTPYVRKVPISYFLSIVWYREISIKSWSATGFVWLRIEDRESDYGLKKPMGTYLFIIILILQKFRSVTVYSKNDKELNCLVKFCYGPRSAFLKNCSLLKRVFHLQRLRPVTHTPTFSWRRSGRGLAWPRRLYPPYLILQFARELGNLSEHEQVCSYANNIWRRITDVKAPSRMIKLTSWCLNRHYSL